MSERCNESDLLRQAASGDRAALSALLLAHYDGLRRHIERRLAGEPLGPTMADDVLHQTMVRAVQAMRGFQPQGERAFRAWLKTIAENLVKDAQKRRSRERRADEQGRPSRLCGAGSSWAGLVDRVAGDATSPSVAGQRRESVARLRAALASLPDQQREVLERYYLENQSLERIAEALGVSHDSIRGLCYRAKRNLRALMGRSSLYFSA